MTLSGKRILITGAGGGLGQEIAHGFAAAGTHVFLHGRRPEQLEPVAAAIIATGARAEILAFDLGMKRRSQTHLRRKNASISWSIMPVFVTGA